MHAQPYATPIRHVAAIAILTAVALAALVFASRETGAQQLFVACPGGNGDEGGLIQAVSFSSTNSQDDEIHLEEGCLFDFTSVMSTTVGDRAFFDVVEDPGFSLTIHGNGSTFTTSLNMGLMHIDEAAVVILNDLVVTGFRSESGGAIYSSDGDLTINRSTFSNNTAEQDGGAIVNQQGSLTIVDSTFSGNVAEIDDGGAIWSNGPAMITKSTFVSNHSGNSGGGIIQPSDVLQVQNATFSANSAENNSDNSETGTGSAIRTGAGSYVTYSTFSGNSGAVSLDATSSGGLTLFNSVLIGNPGGNCSSNVSAGPGLGNVADNSSCGGGIVTATALGALGDNGGPTETMMPPAGHAAINAGIVGICPSTDQRGAPRSNPCDAGAVERSFPAPIVTVEGAEDGQTYPADSAPTPTCETADAGGGILTPATIVIGGTLPEVIVTCSGATSLDSTAAGPVTITYSLSYPLPIVTVTGVSEGANYPANAVPAPGCQTVDDGGGIGTLASLTTGGTLTNRTATCSGATNGLGQVVPPVVVNYTVDYPLPLVVVTGVQEGAVYTFGSVPTPGCTTSPVNGGGVASNATLSLSTTAASGPITATCSGATNLLGEPSAPVAVNYFVQCQAAETYSGFVNVKQNATNIGPREVVVHVTTNPQTCDITAVQIVPQTTQNGQPAVNTAIGWKAALKQTASQWKFAMQSPSLNAASIRVNNAPRVMDATTALTVKFTGARTGLYLKLTGFAPTGVGITKAGFELETSGMGLTPLQPN